MEFVIVFHVSQRLYHVRTDAIVAPQSVSQTDYRHHLRAV
jgi:hypothetical protein